MNKLEHDARQLTFIGQIRADQHIKIEKNVTLDFIGFHCLAAFGSRSRPMNRDKKPGVADACKLAKKYPERNSKKQVIAYRKTGTQAPGDFS